MEYKVVNEKGRIAFGGEKFSSKKAAEQAIVDAIKGGDSKNAMKYYQKYSVRKA